LPNDVVGAATLGPNHNFVISAVVPDFVDDAEVDAIKHAIGNKALYVWGIVLYRDAFGRLRKTEFCQTLTWVGPADKENIFGYYNQRHNDAT
jgi:hypothetical protein